MHCKCHTENGVLCLCLHRTIQPCGENCYLIQEIHECKDANQHEAVQIISIKDHEYPWTLRIDLNHKKMIGDIEDTVFHIDIKYCPYCGVLLDPNF